MYTRHHRINPPPLIKTRAGFWEMKIEQNKNPRENLEEKMNKIKTRAKRGKIFGQNKNPRAKRARKF